jgi:hypothetical protein
VSFWGSQEPPSRSDVPVITTRYSCWDGYIQQANIKKTLALLEQEPSTRQNINSRLLLTYLNQDMLAKNEMDVQQ